MAPVLSPRHRPDADDERLDYLTKLIRHHLPELTEAEVDRTRRDANLRFGGAGADGGAVTMIQPQSRR